MDFDYIKNYVTNFDLMKANFFEVLKECFTFSGTMNRTKFWTFSIILGVAVSIVSTILGLVPILGWLASFLIGVVGFAMSLGPSARRLRDAGFPPAALFAHILIGLGAFIIAVLCCFPSKEGSTAPVVENSAPEAQNNDQPQA